MNWSAVLFDFDYTLGDATEAIVTGFQYAFGQMGRPIPEREAVRLTVGHRLEDSYTLLTGDGDPARQAEFRRLYKQKADPLQVPATRLLPGALELLEALNAQGIPAGVVSTKGRYCARCSRPRGRTIWLPPSPAEIRSRLPSRTRKDFWGPSRPWG